MFFSDYRTSVLNKVSNDYPVFLTENFNKEKIYLGCGSCNAETHIYLALICALPIFKSLQESNLILVENFGWERKFEELKIKDQLKSPEQTIHFFANYKKAGSFRGAQAFIFRPEQLVKISATLKGIFPEKSDKEIIQDVFKNSRSPVREKLLTLTQQRLETEKQAIVNANWKKAINHLKHCHLVKFIQLMWDNVKIKRDTKHLIEALTLIERRHFGVSVGNENCNDDVIGPCQLDDKYKLQEI